MKKLFGKSIILAISSVLTISCSSGGGASSSSMSSSDFIESLTSGQSWSSETGFDSSSAHSPSPSEEAPKEAIITFATGEGTPIAPLTVQVGTRFEEGAFERSYRPHYEFGGWYIDPYYNLAVTYPFVVVGNMTLYAKWNQIRHLVTFITGTSETMNPVYVNDGDYIQEPVPPSNGNYKFAGWYLDEDLTRKATFPYIVTSPVTFYAKYDIVFRTITFHSNGGSLINALLVEDGEIITDALEAPTHDYFTFAGWYFDDALTNPVQYPFIVREDLHLFAKWTNIEAKISFQTNGGASLDPLSAEKGTAIYSLPVPQKEDATFLGWYLDEDLVNPVSLPITLASDITLYASWRIIDCRLSFETNGAPSVQSIEKSKGSTIEESEIQAPSWAHHEFLGWYTDAQLTTKAIFPFVLESNTTLYAKWQLSTYTVTYHANGGSSVASETIEYGDIIPVAPQTSQVGYDFLGWYLDEEMTRKANFPLTISGNIDLYAKWKEKTFAVNFNSNGGLDYPAVEKKYGELLQESEVPAPSKDGNRFLGWYLDSTLAEKAIFPLVVSSNITLHAKWEFIVTSSVRFDANGGTGSSYQVVENGTSIAAPAVPSRPGYSFLGWTTEKDGATLANFPYVVNGSVAFYAKWEALTYYVVFHSNGGSLVDTKVMNYGDTLYGAVEPTRTGYDFLGWYLDAELTEKALFPVVIEKDIDLYAKWKEQVLAVSFNTNGAAEIPSISKKYGEMLEESEVTTPTRDGNRFLGWYLDFDLNEPAIFPIEVKSNITLHAKWENIVTSSVRFDADGGTGSSYQVVENGTSITAPAAPSRPGYSFLGWTMDKEGNTPAAFPYIVNGSVTFYAKWEALTYYVVFHSNGGSAIETKTMHYGDTLYAIEEPTRTGYGFLGWYLDESLTQKANFPLTIDKDIDLYAKWDDSVYTIEFNTNGAQEMQSLNKKYGELLNENEVVAPSRDGNHFLGWYLDYELTQPAEFPIEVKSDLTLHAKWELIVTYSVKFDANGGIGGTYRVVENGQTTSAAEAPTRTGYDFLGWYIDKDGSTPATFPYTVNGSVTFYAKWEPISYNVNYHTNGGSVIDAQEIHYGETLFVTPETTRTGYDFLGWYLDEGLTQKANLPIVIDRNIDLYAKWGVSQYKVDFNTNGAQEIPSIAKNHGDLLLESEISAPCKEGNRFLGWYLDYELTQPAEFPLEITSSITLHAKWQYVVNSSVRFDANGGTGSSYQIVENGTSIDAAAAPSRPGYSFVGWTLEKDGTSLVMFPYTVNGSVTFYAKWQALDYYVVFHSNGGTTIDTKTVHYGDSVYATETPVRTGYDFLGWYLDEQLTQKANFPLTIDQDINLYAKWGISVFHVDFNTNGADEMSSVDMQYGEELNISDITAPTKDGSRFLGWYLDYECTQPVQFPLVITSDMTLHAKWELIITYSVRFDPNGGTGGTYRVVESGQTTSAAEAPTRTGYNFLGWYMDKEGTTPASFPYTVNGSVTFYAKWEQVSYDVTYHVNGGSEIEAQAKHYGDSLVEPTAPTKEGSVFQGWYLDEECTIKAEFPITITDDVDLYAKWKELVFAVNFNSNGGLDYPSIEKKYGETLTESEVPAPSKSHNVFLGWYLDFELTTPVEFPLTITSDITLHAKWQYITTYSVRFDANGGSGGAYYVVENGQSVTATPEPSRPGYSFVGWAIDKEGTALAQFPYVVSGSVTFYAKWEALSYTVVFNTNGGSAIAPLQLGYGEAVNEPTAPTKEGYVFLGWYLDPDFNTPAAFPLIISDDMTLYAKWREVDYCTITFEYGDRTESVQVQKGGAIEEPAEPTKEGYTFVGWYVDPDFNTAANFPYLVTESMAFFAKWERIESAVTVTFETGNGTAIAPIVVTSGSTINEPATPYSPAGEFLGWYLDSSFNTPAAFPLVIEADTTLYAKFASYEQTYTVTFETGSGSTMASQVVHATGSLLEPTIIPTNPGYIFAGWYLDNSFNTEARFPMSINGDTTLYARWIDDPNTYRVIFTDGINGDRLYVINVGETVSRPTDPTRSGYTFGGWFLDEACTGSALSFPFAPSGDITIYAKWTLEIVTYTVTWVFNNGNADQQQSVDNGNSISALSPTRSGYDFAGWYFDEALTQKVGFPYRVNGNVTFYAKWEKQIVNYTVTYVTSGGTTIAPTTVVEGGSVSTPSTPARSGYIFTGWYVDADCTQKATFPMVINADTYIYAGWRVDPFAAYTFEYSDTLGGYVITDYENGETNLVLPEIYDDGIHGSATVVAIGKSAFENCTSLVSIVIPDTITSIGDSAFFGCSSLVSITIPASVSSLGMRTFYKCIALETVNLPDTVTSIGAWSFYGCTALKEIRLPSELSAITDYLFYSSGLERIVIHSNCLTIGNFAFYNCVDLAQVTIAEGCTSIGNSAFRGCVALRQLTIPVTVTTIGGYIVVDDSFAVIYCSQSGNLSGFNTYWTRLSSDPDETSTAPVIYNYGGAYVRVDDVVYALLKDGSVSATYIGPRDVISVVLVDQVEINERVYDVTSIGTRGFRNLKSLQNVVFPAKLQSISSYAFQGCSALLQISLPSTTLSIDPYAFNNCTSLAKVTLPASLTTISEHAFRSCTALKEIFVPESVVSLSSYAFSMCNGIIIMLARNENPWFDASNYIVLSQSAGRYYYEGGIYYSLTKQGNVIVSKGDRDLLTVNILSSVVIDDVTYFVTGIGREAFSEQRMLDNVALPNTIKTIGYNAFYGCSNLSNISLGNSLTTIEQHAFYDCDQLRVIEFPATITTLGGYLFQECNNHVTVLSRSESLSYDRYSLYQNNNNFASIVFGYVGKYATVDFVIYALTSNGVYAAGYLGFINSLVIPDSIEIDGFVYPVKGIGDFAFSGQTNLSSIVIGQNVERIGCYAFNSGEYTEVILPEKVQYVGDCAFQNGHDGSITLFIAPFAIEGQFNYEAIKETYFGTIGSLFEHDENRYGLTASGGAILLTWNGGINGELVLPDIVKDANGDSRTVRAIGNRVFYDADGLTKVVLPVGLEAICRSAFAGCDYLQEVVYEGNELATIAECAFENCYALHSANIFANVTKIGDYAFQGCSCLSNVNFGERLTIIGAFAFYNCSQLRRVEIPDSVIRIESSAFSQCYGLEIVLGSGIQYIGESAFSNCGSLTAIIFSDALIRIEDNAFNGVTIDFVYIPESATIYSRSFTSGNIYFGKDTLDKVILNQFKNNGVTAILGCSGLVVTDSAIYAAFSNGEAGLAKYTGSSGSYEVLSEISLQGDTYPVTRILSKACYENYSLSRIVLPDSLIEIEAYAFKGCGQLSNIVWGKGLQVIDGHAFESCQFLRRIVLPDSLMSLKEYAFAYGYGATVYIPASVTELGSNCFTGVTVFTESTSYTETQSAAFIDCTIKYNCVGIATIGDYEFALFADNTAAALAYSGSVSEIVLDAVISYGNKNYNVTALSSSLYAEHDEIETIALPDGITEIPANLLANCNNLSSVSLPDSILSIGNSAFSNCGALSAINIGNNVHSIGNSAFDRCNSLLALSFPSTLTSIGSSAFNYCSSLQSIAFPGIETIGDHAFYYCDALKNVTWGENLRVIGPNAFQECRALVFTVLPDSLEELGQYAFAYTNIASLHTGNGLSIISDYAFYQCTSLKTVVLGESTVTIGLNAFWNCGLNTVEFNSGLKVIESGAFDSCYNLKTVILPSGLTTLGYSAFGNIYLQTVFVPSSVTSFGDYCFSQGTIYFGASSLANPSALGSNCVRVFNCVGIVEQDGFTFVLLKNGTASLLSYDGSEKDIILSSVNYGNKEYAIAEIGAGAFSGKRIASIELPSSLMVIGRDAFRECAYLTSITFGDALTTIASGAFNNCSRLESIVFGTGLTAIGDSAFSQTKITSVALPDSLIAIGADAFAYAYNLNSVTFGSGLETIGARAFYYTQISSVILPEGLLSIGDRAFADCYSMKMAFIPQSAVNFGENCFTNGNVYYAGSSIPQEAIGNNADIVYDCDGIFVSNSLTYVLFTNQSATILFYDGTDSVLNLTSSVEFGGTLYTVKAIAANAFAERTSLTNISLPDTLETIGNHAFLHTGLLSITLPSSLIAIGDYAFCNCYSLNTVAFAEGLKSIGNSAFAQCQQLSSVVLPNGLTSVGEFAFQYCYDLRTIYLPSTVISLGNECFDRGNIYYGGSALPEGTSIAYNSITYNCTGLYQDDVAHYVLFNDGTAMLVSYNGNASTVILAEVVAFKGTDYVLTQIGENAFAQNIAIQEVTMPDSIVLIGHFAFYGCTKLEAVHLSSTLQNIGNYAFYSTALSSLSTPNALVSIGDYAFGECRHLSTITLNNGLEAIGTSAFASCPMKPFLLPSSVTQIGNAAFNGVMVCLTQDTLPDNFSSAFSNCRIALSSIGLMNQDGLRYVLFANGSADVVSYDGTSIEVSIPASVSYSGNAYSVGSIQPYAFANNREITSVVLSTTIKQIGDYAFYGCSSLANIDLSSVTHIGAYSFSNTALTTLLMNSIVSIGNNAFSQPAEASTLKLIYVGDSIDYVGSSAFYTANTAVLLFATAEPGNQWDSNWTSTWSSADRRWNCKAYLIDGPILYYVTGTDNSMNFLLMDKSITNLTLGGTVLIAGQSYTISSIDYTCGFARSAIEELTLMETIQTIGNEAFANCQALRKVTFANVETIGSSAFSNCTALSEINWGSALETIGSNAFSNCDSLTSTTLPLGLTTINYDAFGYCDALQAIYIPQTVTTFEGQSYLKAIIMTPLATTTWDPGVPVVYNATGEWFVDNDIVYAVNRNGKVTLASYRGSETNVVLPSSATNGDTTYEVTTIGSYSFNASNIVSIVLPDSIASVKRHAFYYCEKLTCIEILSGTSFEYESFNMLSKLNTVLIHSGVKLNNSQIFQFNNSSQKVVFLIEGSTSGWGSSSWAYAWNGGFNEIFTVIENSNLTTFESDGVIYAPTNDGNVVVAGAVSGTTSITLPESVVYEGNTYAVTSIAQSAFRGHTDLESIIIPSTIISVGRAAFANCYSLTSVHWSASTNMINEHTFNGDMMLQEIILDSTMLQQINYRAFYACSSLTSIVLPANVTWIGTEAFAQCGELAHIYSRSTSQGSVGHDTLPNDLSIEYGYQDE